MNDDTLIQPLHGRNEMTENAGANVEGQDAVPLLPCPFCGSGDIATEGPNYTQFMCNGCGAATYDQDGHIEAIAAWNSRFGVVVTGDLILSLIDAINDELVDADVDMPAGRGAGYRISFDEAAMGTTLGNVLSRALHIPAKQDGETR